MNGATNASREMDRMPLTCRSAANCSGVAWTTTRPSSTRWHRELVARGDRLDDRDVTPNDRANRLRGAAQNKRQQIA